MVDFREMPLTLSSVINPYTGGRLYDDTGYRNVSVSRAGAENPDPLVPLHSSITFHPVYALGEMRGVCPQYGKGLLGPDRILVRAPVARSLLAVDEMLALYERKLLVLDGWRPWWVQAKIFAYVFSQMCEAENVTVPLSLFDTVRMGLAADKIGSYCTLLQDDACQQEVRKLVDGSRAEEFRVVASQLKKTPYEIALLYLTILKNRNPGRGVVRIDKDAVTAHNNGGSVDVMTINAETGLPCNLGSYFDSFGAPAGRDYFEWATWDMYAEEVQKDPLLRQYLNELGVSHITREVFYEIQRERRILEGAMKGEGFTGYEYEIWHNNGGNQRGGNQARESPGNGNACQAFLTGYLECVWDAPTATCLAQAFFSS